MHAWPMQHSVCLFFGNERFYSWIWVNAHTQDGVLKLLRRHKNKLSFGLDGLCPWVLKSCATNLSYPFQVIFNKCIHEGKLLKSWNSIKVIPIPKKTNPICRKDFLPIGLTSPALRSFESRLLQELQHKKTLGNDPCQFAYRPKMSTASAIASLCTPSFLTRGQPPLLGVSFSSAFKTINRQDVVSNLSESNVPVWFLNIMKSYLSERYQYVGKESSPKIVCQTM